MKEEVAAVVEEVVEEAVEEAVVVKVSGGGTSCRNSNSMSEPA